MRVLIGKVDLSGIDSVEVRIVRGADPRGNLIGETNPIELEVIRSVDKSFEVTDQPLKELVNLGEPSEVEIVFSDGAGADLTTFKLEAVFVQHCTISWTEGAPTQEVIVMQAGKLTMEVNGKAMTYECAGEMY